MVLVSVACVTIRFQGTLTRWFLWVTAICVMPPVRRYA